MPSRTFYADLPILDRFVDITNPRNFQPVPADWWVVATDVVGSTEAIAAGRYKEINLLGACSIVAVLNCAKDLDIPFVFGGDGASLLIPPVLRSPVTAALLATQAMAQQSFGLNLRVGLVPVAEVRAAGYGLEVAKLRISAQYSQAVFMGGGLTHATDLLKARGDRTGLELQQLSLDTATADFSGLECRWQDVHSVHGETVSLLVLVLGDDAAANWLYKDVIEHIRRIYGDDQELHPIASEQLNLSFDRQKLLPETQVRRRGQDWWRTQGYLLKIRLENCLGWLLMALNLRVGGVRWGQYKQDVAAATDHRKFDDMLRMVISGTVAQRQRLTQILEQYYQDRRLVYGLHVSDRALLTCLVFERSDRHVHFVDGADGGYALAAKAMKQRLGNPR
jgi:hypothetical protein